jgi:outer membrane receptor for ferrienterochelin and colicins
MKTILAFIFVLLITVVNASEIKGRLVDEAGESIPFVQVMLKGTLLGATSDTNGVFLIDNVPAGEYECLFSAIGYKNFRKTIVVSSNAGVLDLGVLTLSHDMLGLNEVVVTGTMRETFVKASPVKVEVITADRISKQLPVTNLMESLQLMNGIQEVNACGVCFTNSISINGLPGPYTAVLMDGSPIFGNLASVYGLNGIPTQMIDRIEVVRGPSSTLYGSEAIAGVINIITKEPVAANAVAFDMMTTSHDELALNTILTHGNKKWRAQTGVNAFHANRFEDNNSDQISDLLGVDRVSMFSKWQLKRPDYKQFTVAAKVYYENRWNGVESFFNNRNYRTLRGNDSIYGESIYTRRAELFGTYDLPGKEDIRVDYSFSWHGQDSYYGSDHYEAEQHIAFTNLIWTKRVKKHTIIGGITNRYQFYDDNTVATNEALNNEPERQYIPGVFLEDEWQVAKRFVLLGGMRLDAYQQHGLIPSPRFSAKWEIDQWTAIRLNSGTGFKVVNLFTEDHAFVSGQRAVEIREQLLPERSWNVATNLHHTHALWGTAGSFDVDVYYTRFTNKINPNYDEPGKIIYENIPGFAESYGLSAMFTQQFTIPLSYSLGVNLNKTLNTTFEDDKTVSEPLPFAPLWSSVFTLNYKMRPWKLDLAYSANFNGPMHLPAVFDVNADGSLKDQPRSQISESFMIHTIQLTKCVGKKDRWDIYGGVQNIFNYMQPISPLAGFNDPNYRVGFSPFFDTAYAFAPMDGREFFIGLRLNI